MGHRFYDPAVGRFLNPDPIGFAGGLNLYAYCGGNPVGAVDPSGLYEEGPRPEHLAIIGGGARTLAPMAGKLAPRALAPNLAPPHIIPILITTGAVVETVRYAQSGQASGPLTWLGVQVGSWLYPNSPVGDAWDFPGSSASMYRWLQARHTQQSTITAEVVPCDKHHTVPREILKMLPPPIARAVRGKRGAPNMWRIPRPLHRKIHEGPGRGRYNERFKEELGKVEEGDLTALKVLEIRDKLAQEFGIDKYRP